MGFFLPAVYSQRSFGTGGGLIAYGPDYLDQFRRAAGHVDRLLKGEIRFQQPGRSGFHLAGQWVARICPPAREPCGLLCLLPVDAAQAGLCRLGRDVPGSQTARPQPRMPINHPFVEIPRIAFPGPDANQRPAG